MTSKRNEVEVKSETILLSKFICPAYRNIYFDIKNNKYTHYWFKGGRGSGKSTFIAICIVLGVMRSGENAIIFRKTENKLRESVYEQILWVLDKFEITRFWTQKPSANELTYVRNKGRIFFRGLNDASRLKSIKTVSGRFAYVWIEEADEFSSVTEISSILQSVLRGEGKFTVFYSFNPPKYASHWINTEAAASRKDKIVHHTTYLDIPKNWLGSAFIAEAEYLKEKNYLRYQNEYLGETGKTGGEVFANVTIRDIPDDEKLYFSNIRRGVDFGFAVDPFVYVCLEYNKKNRKISIFHELYQRALSNERAANHIIGENISNDLVFADCAEPKSISELRSYGINICGAKKGRDSVYYGIKFLQDLDEIIIDPKCENAAREFSGYHYLLDSNGSFMPVFADKDNHVIDAVRYALNNDMQFNNVIIHDKRKFSGIL